MAATSLHSPKVIFYFVGAVGVVRLGLQGRQGPQVRRALRDLQAQQGRQELRASPVLLEEPPEFLGRQVRLDPRALRGQQGLLGLRARKVPPDLRAQLDLKASRALLAPPELWVPRGLQVQLELSEPPGQLGRRVLLGSLVFRAPRVRLELRELREPRELRVLLVPQEPSGRLEPLDRRGLLGLPESPVRQGPPELPGLWVRQERLVRRERQVPQALSELQVQ
jgi:hypothetical protein